MWHVKAQIAPAVLLVVDFGGWHRIDSKSSNGSSSERIQHTQVSLLKDVIVPYTHLLPQLPLSENSKRHTLLYFKGAKHRHGVSFSTCCFLDCIHTLFENLILSAVSCRTYRGYWLLSFFRSYQFGFPLKSICYYD
ncbi:hypothetical protein LINPERHAP2_LOCUS23711 [Linum perenne]